jgi:cytochrome c-type biogenesis protein CcmH/NrfF
MRMRWTRLLVLAAAAGLGAAAPVWAQTPTPASESVAQQAIGQIRSPYCPGLMLEVCPTPQADLLRDSIRTLAAEGRSVRQIVDGVLAAHGEQYRALPRRTGAGAWAWVMPPLVLLVGLALVAWRIVQLRRVRAGVAEPAATPLSDAERARLDAALRGFDREEVAP